MVYICIVDKSWKQNLNIINWLMLEGDALNSYVQAPQLSFFG
jgi:hypothetical protein